MRIIAGRAKGHILKAPKGMSTRPTQDRVRESIFNILTSYGLIESTVLDFSPVQALSDWKPSVAVPHWPYALINGQLELLKRTLSIVIWKTRLK